MSAPTYWLVLALLALIAEFFSGALYLLTVSIALVCMAAVAWLGGNLLAQALLGSLIALVGFTVVWRYRRRQVPAAPQLNDPDLGQTVEVLQVLGDGFGRVHYRGTEWDAELLDPTLQPGRRGVIVGRDGNRLKISV
jgi:membrane protein implicated in regulation of membrane protease activity